MVKVHVLLSLVAISTVVLFGTIITKPIFSPEPEAAALLTLPPTDWTARVIFKGCGQYATVHMRTSGRLLLYNGGTVNRYIRQGIPLPPDGSHTIVPKDWRLLTFSTTGIHTITLTTSFCTLWSPKIVVTVTS